MGANEGTKYGNGDGGGDPWNNTGNEDGSGDGNENSSGHGNGEGGGEAKKRNKKRRLERIGSIAADPDNLENRNKAGGEVQGTQGLNENCTSRESVPPLSRLIINRGFRKKYH